MRSGILGVAALAVALIGLTAGCAGRQPAIYGVAPVAAATVTAIAGLPKAGTAPVTIRGRMIEKCPVAGCWFRVQDASGVIRVDTKAAGFVVSDVPLNSFVTVSGSMTDGEEKEITASGLRCE